MHHPEVFGEVSEEDTQAYEAWQSQFAWATAVVNVRSIVINDEEGSACPPPPPVLPLAAIWVPQRHASDYTLCVFACRDATTDPVRSLVPLLDMMVLQVRCRALMCRERAGLS